LWLGLVGCSSPSGPACPALSGRPYDARSDDTFPRGPWLAHAWPDRLVVGFETAEACRGRLEFGRAGQALAVAAEEPEPVTEHRLEATGLAPDTRYAYRLACGPATGEAHTAYTAPAPGAPVRLVVLGDTQDHPEVSARVIAEMAAFEPHLALHVGDAVGDGRLLEHWDEQLHGPFRAFQDHVPVYFAMGNHERQGEGYFRRSPGPLLSPESPNASCFAFTVGNLFVLVVDTEQAFFPLAEVDTPISAWIREAVASPAARAAAWRLAIGHQPARAEGWSPGACEPPDTFDGYPPVATWLLPWLAEHGFQAYFSGHTHAYERGRVAGVNTFVTGGGGGGLDEHCRDLPEIEVFRAVHHHLRLTAGCDSLVVEAWALGEAAPFDRFELRLLDD
jgi:hypothetical protein